MSESQKAFRDQESLIAKMTAKMQKSDETISELMEQVNVTEHRLKKEAINFESRLQQTQENFSEMIQVWYRARSRSQELHLLVK